MNTLSYTGAYQEIVMPNKISALPDHWRRTSAAQTTATQPLSSGLSELNSWAEGGFSQLCRDFYPAVAEHNVHMNLTHTAMSVQPQSQGSPSSWLHLCSLAQWVPIGLRGTGTLHQAQKASRESCM